jgi:hypothetical protein
LRVDLKDSSMSSLLSLVILVSTAVVVAALFLVLWRERASRRDGRIALVSGAALAVWAVITTVLAREGVFQSAAEEGVPPVGITLAVVLLVLAVCLSVSGSLRSLLSRQSSLIRLHLWRFLGITFLILMAQGRVPALWAIPAGIGDILVAATAPWVARHVETPRGRRRAIIWHWLGLADLIVAIALGVTTTPGALHVFDTVPSSEAMTGFPMALVPTFLVPLAMALHVISLWQLLGRSWARSSVERGSEPRRLRGPVSETRAPARERRLS